jgi:hypothetical protein
MEGHEQQVGLAGFVPEDAFSVDPGGVVVEATGRAHQRLKTLPANPAKIQSL